MKLNSVLFFEVPKGAFKSGWTSPVKVVGGSCFGQLYLELGTLLPTHEGGYHYSGILRTTAENTFQKDRFITIFSRVLLSTSSLACYAYTLLI